MKGTFRLGQMDRKDGITVYQIFFSRMFQECMVATSEGSKELVQELCLALNGEPVTTIKGWEFWDNERDVVASDGDVPCCVLTACSYYWAKRIARILANAAVASQRAS